MIIVVSEIDDIHAHAVSKFLTEVYKTKNIILDFSKYPPSDFSVSIENNKLFSTFSSPIEFSLDDITTIWWRRPQNFKVDNDILDSRLKKFTEKEWWASIGGIIQSFNCRVVNNIAAQNRANYKLLQLKVANEVGLLIPKTLITNSTLKAEKFIIENNYDVIYKAQTGAEYHMGETRKIDMRAMKLLDLVNICPVQFQEHIPAKFDIRVTIIGRKIFATKILSQNSIPNIDWRLDLMVPTENMELDEVISGKLITLMDKLNLDYGAIDLRMKPNGDIVFFEVNTSGQYLFCEDPVKMSITRALCEHLISPNNK